MDIIHLNSEWIVKSTCKCNIHHAQLTFKTQISDGHISMECTWAPRNIYYCTILVLFVFMSVYTLIFFYVLFLFIFYLIFYLYYDFPSWAKQCWQTISSGVSTVNVTSVCGVSHSWYLKYFFKPKLPLRWQ